MTARPIKILVADDSGALRLFIDRALKASGREVFVVNVANGRDAAKQLTDGTFDIAFLDIQMPELSGVEVLQAASQSSHKTFCVTMSSNLSADDEALLKRFGAYDFLPKPFGEERLQQILATWDMFHTAHDVLVVDDSATVRKIVLKVLARSIFTLKITEAGDGPGALLALEKKPYRLIFSDFNMPGMTGIQLANEIAKRGKGADVVLMSTEYTPVLDAAAQKVGARAFLRKPFYPEDVDSIIHHVFKLPHPRFSKQVRVFATN